MKSKNLFMRYIPMSLVAILIIFFAVRNALYPAEGKEVELWYLIFKTTPTLVTLAVQLLLIAANRYGFLLGGTNSILYAIVYFIEGVPFSGFFALLVSAPIQIYSFFEWKKNSKGSKVSLRTLSTKWRIIVGVSILALWAVCYFWLSRYMRMTIPLCDTVIFTLGTVVTVLAAIRFIESQYLSFISSLVSLVMWIILTVRDPSNINYAIISIYNAYCVGQTAVNWTVLYVKDMRTRRLEKKSSADA